MKSSRSEYLQFEGVSNVAIIAVQALANFVSNSAVTSSVQFADEDFDRGLNNELEVDASSSLQFSEVLNALGLKVAEAFLLKKRK